MGQDRDRMFSTPDCQGLFSLHVPDAIPIPVFSNIEELWIQYLKYPSFRCVP